MPLELRHWRAFVAAAEAKHFGVAAEVLGISQPALSQLIRTIETEFSVKLFDRSHRRIALTEAGEHLLPEARALLGQSLRAERTGLVAGRSEQRILTVGYVGSAALHPRFASLMKQLASTRPAITTKLDQLPATTQIDRIKERNLDIGVVRSPMPAIEPGLAVLTLDRERMTIALAADHPAALERVCDLSSFADDDFIQYERQPSGGLRLLTLSACEAAGIEPRISQSVPQIATMLALVGAGLGVALVPASAARLGVPGVVFRDLRAPIVSDLNLVYRKSDAASATRRALAIARRVDKLKL
jgi:DNA-binding transcriptional LysR family regulator